MYVRMYVSYPALFYSSKGKLFTLSIILCKYAYYTQGRRETTLIGGGVFIESPEYSTFIKLPEFYWMH